ncbi:hypothetical protein HDU86_000581 [Geranomyces michiganensis]|nr:hypothetical protein HDU86_000581 [Geranomyces michiganensis]
MLMTLYLVEAVAIGSIGSLYYTDPVPHIKATGHMPAWGPRELVITSQNDASIPYQAAQDAFLSGTRLYDPLVAGSLLMPDEATCPGATPSVGWYTGCASIVASSLTVPTVQTEATDEQELPWVNIIPGDIFEGPLSTVGVSATCGPMDDVITDFEREDHAYYVFLPVENGQDKLQNPVSLYGASEDYFITPNIQILTMGHGDNVFEPYVDADGAMWVGLVAYNFEKPFADMAIRPIQVNAETTRSLSFGLCKLKPNVGTAHTRVLVNYTEPTRVSKLLSATPLGKPHPFDLRNESIGFGNNVSGYGVAHFLFQALQEVSCDMIPLPPSADEEDEVDAPRDMRQMAENRIMVATVDPVTGSVRLSVKASKTDA